MPFRRAGTSALDPAPILQKIDKGKSVIQYPEAKIIYAQGDVCDALYFLQIGQVKFTVCSPKGKEAIIGLSSPGDFFGEGCLIGRSNHIATATAIRDSTVIRVEKAVMAKLLRTEPKLSEAFLSYLLTREISIEEELVDQIFSSTEKRLARVLLLLARSSKGRGTPATVPRLTHETLAQMIGATRAQVSTFMSKFRKNGYIDYNDAIEVNKSLADVVSKE